MAYHMTGAVPDHVTRYNHKQNRWMTPPKPYHRTTAAEIAECIILMVAFAVMITVGVMLLQVA